MRLATGVVLMTGRTPGAGAASLGLWWLSGVVVLNVVVVVEWVVLPHWDCGG